MAEEIKNIGASVRARLLNFSRDKGLLFELVLTRYAVERLLYRLANSPHAERFVLKGAMLLMTWFEEPFRGTRDLDLLGQGDPAPEAVLAIFREILAIDEPDGVSFDAEGTRIDRIREDTEYGGVRIRTTAEIGGARIPVSVDVGFGDVTEPAAQMLDYPILLDMPAPRLRGYARETVVAEKFQAIVILGQANSRVKDYYDLWVMSRYFTFDEDRLASAIAATFARRRTAIPSQTPEGLTHAFAEDPQKQAQWERFKKDVTIDPGSLSDVVAALEPFLMQSAGAARAVK
ncbi:MAG: nucleotidyl transferase AbiEii/AbiGii toxin family protein [Oricola sp.]|nr:MAG: nucleotidyl transferase AbiEii/AbiGii toxin family protein [Oricola sp.]